VAEQAGPAGPAVAFGPQVERVRVAAAGYGWSRGGLNTRPGLPGAPRHMTVIAQWAHAGRRVVARGKVRRAAIELTQVSGACSAAHCTTAARCGLVTMASCPAGRSAAAAACTHPWVKSAYSLGTTSTYLGTTKV
jgi:hypothetical protein